MRMYLCMRDYNDLYTLMNDMASSFFHLFLIFIPLIFPLLMIYRPFSENYRIRGNFNLLVIGNQLYGIVHRKTKKNTEKKTKTRIVITVCAVQFKVIAKSVLSGTKLLYRQFLTVF
jgi:hypothetical protein